MGLLFLPFLLILLLGVASMVLWIWALIDCIQVPDDAMYRSGTKLIWVLVIVFATVVGAIVYLAIGRPEPGAAARPPTSLPAPPPPS